MPNHRRLGLLSLLLGLLWASHSYAQAEFSPDTGQNFGSWNKSFQGAPAGPTCSVPSNVTSLTPDPARCHVYGIQLGTSLTINNPQPGTLLPGEPQIFELQQPGAGPAVTPSIGTSYHLPGGVISLSGLLSTGGGQRDLWACQASTLGGSPQQLECQNPTLNIGSAPVILTSASANNTGAGSTLAVTLSGYTGHPLIIGTFFCDGGGTGTCVTGGAAITSITATSGNACSEASGARNASKEVTSVWGCGSGTAGSNTITVNCSGGGGCYYIHAIVTEWSRLTGSCSLGNQTFITSGTSGSLAINGSTTAPNSIIFADGNAHLPAPVASDVAISSVDTLTAEYQMGSALQNYTDNFTISGGSLSTSRPLSMSVAACS